MIISPSKALAVACLSPIIPKPITEASQSINKVIFTGVPMDFKFETNILSPKIKNMKNGIPTAKKVSKDKSHSGLLLIFNTWYQSPKAPPQNPNVPAVNNPIISPTRVVSAIIMTRIPINLTNIVSNVRRILPSESIKRVVPLCTFCPNLS